MIGRERDTWLLNPQPGQPSAQRAQVLQTMSCSGPAGSRSSSPNLDTAVPLQLQKKPSSAASLVPASAVIRTLNLPPAQLIPLGLVRCTERRRARVSARPGPRLRSLALAVQTQPRLTSSMTLGKGTSRACLPRVKFMKYLNTPKCLES